MLGKILVLAAILVGIAGIMNTKVSTYDEHPKEGLNDTHRTETSQY